jgi:hypothetical protein
MKIDHFLNIDGRCTIQKLIQHLQTRLDNGWSPETEVIIQLEKRGDSFGNILHSIDFNYDEPEKTEKLLLLMFF